MEGIVKGAIGLATEGFFEGVEAGAIVVHRDSTITRLFAKAGRPFAELSDGTVLPADLIICATGFTQGVPFLDQDVQDRILDERSNFMLYRQILPLGVDGLYFDGYNSSFFSPAQRRDGRGLDRRAPGRGGAVARADRYAPGRRRATGFHGHGHRPPPLPRYEDHPVLDAQRR
jgi:hypothetical protein